MWMGISDNYGGYNASYLKPNYLPAGFLGRRFTAGLAGMAGGAGFNCMDIVEDIRPLCYICSLTCVKTFI